MDDLVKRLRKRAHEPIACTPFNILMEAADRVEELEAKLTKAVEALSGISNQKKTNELESEYDVEVADFEGGYDTCIDVARTTLAELTGDSDV